MAFGAIPGLMTYNPKKKGYRKQKPKGKSALKVAKRALSLAQNNTTIEFNNYTRTDTAVTGSGTYQIVLLQPPTVESLPAKQKILSIYGTVVWKQNLTSVVNDDYKLDIVLDRQPAGVAPDPQNIYGSSSFLLQQNMTYTGSDRFKILRSFKGIFNEAVKTSSVHNFKFPVNLISEADTVNFAQADINKNAIYLIFSSTAAANIPTLAYNVTIVSQTT